jgi:hypothetical protein
MLYVLVIVANWARRPELYHQPSKLAKLIRFLPPVRRVTVEVSTVTVCRPANFADWCLRNVLWGRGTGPGRRSGSTQLDRPPSRRPGSLLPVGTRTAIRVEPTGGRGLFYSG